MLEMALSRMQVNIVVEDGYAYTGVTDYVCIEPELWAPNEN